MPDPLFQSMHLEGTPRRELFRIARKQLEQGCSPQTLAGDLELLDDHDVNDGQTMPYDGQKGGVFYLQDGEQLHELHVGINSVGRLPDNDVVIRDECVSRRHCAVVVHRDGKCEVHDVASKNGTLLNGLKIQGPSVLKAGDRIGLCSRKITFLVRMPS